MARDGATCPVLDSRGLDSRVMKSVPSAGSGWVLLRQALPGDHALLRLNRTTLPGLVCPSVSRRSRSSSNEADGHPITADYVSGQTIDPPPEKAVSRRLHRHTKERYRTIGDHSFRRVIG